MNKDKEPLMSAEQFYKGVLVNLSTAELMKAYAKYHTEWHLNNLKDVQPDGVYTFKQSITNAIENYIKENL